MKTNEELGITQEERDALWMTRETLSLETLRHEDEHEDQTKRAPMGVLFNMNTSSDRYDCGTVMCIGGFMQLFMLGARPDIKGNYRVTERRERLIDEYVLSHCEFGVRGSRPIAKLFYPEDADNVNWSSLTKAQAVKAIDNFLASGDPDWRGIVEDAAA